MTLIPPLPSPWKICDIDTLLRAGEFAALDAQLDAALAASFDSRDAEERYYGALPADLSGCTEAGADGLARLRAWQAARPQSAHAWLCEAHYWYHWAYEYRGSGWADSVTQLGWACAHACATRTAVAALRALVLAPTMWSAPALLVQSVSAFSEPDWLEKLVQQRRWPVTELGSEWPWEENIREELLAMMARSGLRHDERIACPTEFPEALPSAMDGKKLRTGTAYWMRATLHIHPRLFFAMRQFVWFMQPRWGGSHDRIRAFIASDTCAHLSELEKDRLRHEIWRDDYLGNEVDEDDEAEDVRRWMAETRARADVALHAYHRWETLYWMAKGHYMRSDYPQAYALLQEAERHHPIDDDRAMAIAQYLALKLDPQGAWLGQATVRAAEAHECTAAMVLHGYCSTHGLLGFVPDAARGEAWLAAARQHAPGSLAWNQVANGFWRLDRNADAHALAQLGLAAGGDSCSYLLGLIHEEGLNGAPDLHEAARCFRQAMEEGGNMGAYKLGYASYNLAQALPEGAERSRLQQQAVDAAQKAHEMGHTEGLQSLLMFISDLDDIPTRHRYVGLVREHAQAGNATAMASLSSLTADNSDKTLYDYRESVRWILGAQALAPDDEYVRNVTRNSHEDGFVARMLFKMQRKQIKAHEIPGADNAMV